MATNFFNQLIVSTASGVPPFVVNQTALVTNLNSQYLGGQLGSYYENRDVTAVGFVTGVLTLTRAAGNLTVNLDGRYLTGNQSISISGDASGSGTTSIPLTLNNSGVSAGTYNNVTVNAKGLVTGGSNVSYLTGNQSISITGDATGSGTTGIGLTLASVGTAGTYRSVTTDAKGRVTAGTNPTTLAGYGITDALDTSATAQTKAGSLYINGASLQAGYARLKVLDYALNNTPVNGIRIATTIPRTSAIGMYTLIFEGYRYGDSAPELWAVSFYPYDGGSGVNFISYSASSHGGKCPSLLQLGWVGGFANIFILSDLVYFRRFSIRAVAGAMSEVAGHFEGWTVSDSNPTLAAAVGVVSVGFSNEFGAVVAKGTATATQFISNIATGVAPLTVASTTLVTNLNAQYLGGQLGSYYQNASNLNAGTVPAAQMPAHTGDVTSTAGSVALTLATVATAGTYRSVTVDAKGRVTAGTNPTTLAGYGITDALDTGASSQTKTGNLTLSGVFTQTGEMPAVDALARTHVGNVEAYYQLSRRLQAFNHLGSTTVLEIEAITFAGGGYGGPAARTTWRLSSRNQLNVTRHDENGGVAQVVLKVLNETAVPDANGQNAKYAVGLICGSTTNFLMVYMRARFLEYDSTSRWVTVAQMATATPTTQSGSAMTYSSGWVANTGFVDTAFTEVIVSQKASQLTLTATTGVAPLVIASTTAVANLNSDLLDDQHGAYYRDAGNLNAGTLLAARMPAFTGGDVTSTVGTVALTLANSGVTAGTYRSVTTDAKGRITAGTNPTTLAGYGITDALPLTGGTVSGQLVASATTDPAILLNGGASDSSTHIYTSIGGVGKTRVQRDGTIKGLSLEVRSGSDINAGSAVFSVSNGGVVTGTNFSGPGTGLTGTAAGLSIGGSAAQLNGQAASYYENRDTTAVGFSAGTLTLTRAAGNLTTTIGGRIVAWCEFNGNFATTQSPNAGFNVSSITKNATGDYTVNFTSALANTNYVVSGYAQLDTTNNTSNYNLIVGVARRSGAKATGSCRIGTEYLPTQQLFDAGSIGLAFIAA